MVAYVLGYMLERAASGNDRVCGLGGSGWVRRSAGTASKNRCYNWKILESNWQSPMIIHCKITNKLEVQTRRPGCHPPNSQLAPVAQGLVDSQGPVGPLAAGFASRAPGASPGCYAVRPGSQDSEVLNTPKPSVS